MSDNERLVKVELLGQDFSFYTAESQENMEEILRLVRSAVQDEPGKSPGAIPAMKVAVLGCLTLASQYAELQREYDEYREVSKERMSQLGESIQRCLGDE